jgi:hypothetical protein
MFASKLRIDEAERQKARLGSPSPLNGERAGVRGVGVVGLVSMEKSKVVSTPHPQSLSPLRGEGSPRRAFADIFARASAIAPTQRYLC